MLFAILALRNLREERNLLLSTNAAKNMDLNAFLDGIWEDMQKKNQESTSGIFIIYGGTNLQPWSDLQTLLSFSSTDSKYVALSDVLNATGSMPKIAQ